MENEKATWDDKTPTDEKEKWLAKYDDLKPGAGWYGIVQDKISVNGQPETWVIAMDQKDGMPFNGFSYCFLQQGTQLMDSRTRLPLPVLIQGQPSKGGSPSPPLEDMFTALGEYYLDDPTSLGLS